MRALLDGDIILYRSALSVEQRMYTAYTSSGEPVASSPRKKDLEDYEFSYLTYDAYIDEGDWEDAKKNAQSLIDRIRSRTESYDNYTIYITMGNNYRKDVDPEYKANRTSKPILYKYMLDYMLTLPRVESVWGQEADDALGINQRADTVICSIDKDLKMVPGNHYNFIKDEWFKVNRDEGIRFFYKQLLTGDRTDNIFGVHGVGDKRADKILQDAKTESEMYDAVLEAYEKDATRVLKNARLLWIRQQEDEMWEAPQS